MLEEVSIVLVLIASNCCTLVPNFLAERLMHSCSYVFAGKTDKSFLFILEETVPVFVLSMLGSTLYWVVLPTETNLKTSVTNMAC